MDRISIVISKLDNLHIESVTVYNQNSQMQQYHELKRVISLIGLESIIFSMSSTTILSALIGLLRVKIIASSFSYLVA